MSAEVVELLQHWEITSAETTRLTGGEQKDVWRVDTNGAQYALRLYPAFVSVDSVLRECMWLTDLAAALDEIPRPVPTRTGNLVVQSEGRCAVLAPYVRGVPVDAGVTQHREAMASTLARIHHVAAALNIAGTSAHPALRDLDWHKNHWWDVSAIERLGEGAELWAMTAPRLQQIAGWLAALNGLPAHVIHNDYGIVNVLMRDDEVAGVIDWDWATVDWRMIDVAHAIRTLSRRGRTFDLERALQFVHDYQRAGVVLEAREVEALPDLLRLQITWVALYDLGRACDGRFDRDSMLYRMMTVDGVDTLASTLASSL